MAFTLCDKLSDLPTDERLHYVFGQVLGVQDFRQEQVYLLNKDHRHSRSLHGYGTVWGLDVTQSGSGDDLEIQVSPGLAVDTCGRDVTIANLQCARLNAWLAAASDDGETPNADTLSADESGRVTVYVTLCYDECKTGDQPIFGDPCRPDAEAMQPTRIKDDFRLDLSATPPVQTEEDWVRQIGDMLGRVELVREAEPLNDEERQNLLEQLFAELDSLPPPAEGEAPTEPPEVPPTYRIPREQARDVLREVLRYWVTHVRPLLAPEEDPCILLAAVGFALNDNRVAEGEADEPLTIDNSQRPYLLHTRLLQEWLLSASGQSGADGRTILNGSGPPEAETGQPGDFYLDTDETVLYGPKSESGWPAEGVSLIGPPGADGEDGRTILSGNRAPTPGDGADGDFWLRTPNGDNPMLYGPKTAGTWPEGIPLRGPQGEPGSGGGGGGSRIYQEFINPNMMMAVEDTSVQRVMIPGARTRIGQPAFLWQGNEDEAAVVFTWGAPSGLRRNGRIPPLQLRLYCSAPEAGGVEWLINWRWTRAIRPDGGQQPPATSLSPLDELEASVAMRLFNREDDAAQLVVSRPILLARELDAADFLTVVIRPVELRVPVHLLLVELFEMEAV